MKRKVNEKKRESRYDDRIELSHEFYRKMIVNELRSLYENYGLIPF